MNFKEILGAIKSYFAVVLTFLFLFSFAVVFLWGEYKEIQNQKLEISNKMIALKDSEIRLDKEKYQLQLRLKDKDLELSEKKFQMSKEKNNLKEQIKKLKIYIANVKDNEDRSISEKEKKLDILISQYKKEIRKTKELHALYSHEARKYKSEDMVLRLMEEFAQLGVDINNPDWCNEEYTKRYYKAKAIIEQISALNNEYSISENYQAFVKSNTRRGMVWSNDGECELDKAKNSDAIKSAG